MNTVSNQSQERIRDTQNWFGNWVTTGVKRQSLLTTKSETRLEGATNKENTIRAAIVYL